MRRGLLFGLLSLSQIALSLEPPEASPGSPVIPILEVSGKASNFKLLPDLLRHLQRSKIESAATEHEDAAVYEGVMLRDLLTYAGVPEGSAVRGEYVSWIVILDAIDDYRAVFSLAELDPAFKQGRVLLADSRDGKMLSAKEGPLRLVVQDEKPHARWIRQIRRITVGPAAK